MIYSVVTDVTRHIIVNLKRRSLAVAITVAIAASAAGCSSLIGGGWTYSTEKDETTNITVSKAQRNFVQKDDKSAITTVTLVCEKGGSGNEDQTLELQILSLRDDGGKTKEYQPVEFDEKPIFRFKSDSSARAIDDEIDSSKYNNEMSVVFSSLILPSANFTQLKALASQAALSEALAEQMEAAAKAMGVAGNDNISTTSAQLNSVVEDALGVGTRNFKFPSEEIFISYVAEGGSKRAISFSFDNAQLAKVAEECGWSKNPAPYKQKTGFFDADGTFNPAKAAAKAAAAEAAAPAADAEAAPMAPAAVAAAPAADAAAAPMAPAAQAAATRPSFDCAKAALAVEYMICGSSRLVQLDLELAQLNARAKSFGLTSNPSWTTGGRAWLKKRNACQTEGCVAAAYGERMDYIAIETEEEPG